MARITARRQEPLTPGQANLWHSARFHPGLLWRYRVWMNGHASALLGRRGVSAQRAPADAVHLLAAAEWLAWAQDATSDGGVMGRYRLEKGWSSSYPETTGYIIPTFIALGRTHDAQFLTRAERATRFLLERQLENGAFTANEVAMNSTRPSSFNTGQIINGLVSWYEHTHDPAVLAAARRAGDWLLSIQDEDGAWRRWCYEDKPACYSAHLSCWLADLGVCSGDERYLASARRHLDWVLSHRDPQTGWIDECGFTSEEHRLRLADMHTIAYTLAGVLHTGLILGRRDAVDAVATAAGHVAAVLERLGWLPGALDWNWRQRADSASLTGNAQMALIWMRLGDATGDHAWFQPAYRALDLVKRTQLLESSNRGLRGGIAGADPVWGRYNGGAILSWATKFFIDALMRKAEIEEARCSSRISSNEPA